jgi:hypothetical protein
VVFVSSHYLGAKRDVFAEETLELSTPYLALARRERDRRRVRQLTSGNPTINGRPTMSASNPPRMASRGRHSRSLSSVP